MPAGLRRSSHDVDRLSLPFKSGHLARLYLADIGLDRRASRLGFGARVPGTYERGYDKSGSRDANTCGGNGKETAPRVVYTVITHDAFLPSLLGASC